MTKKNKSKKSVIASLVAIVICFAMLLGTTYAWFTDSIVNTNNIIKSGNVDVELTHTNAYVSDEVVKEDTKLFVNTAGKEILWEPGASTTETLTVSNVGSLALKYELRIKAISKTFNENGESLEEVLTLTVDNKEEDFGVVLSNTLEKGADPISYDVKIEWAQGIKNDNDFTNLKLLLGIELVATQFTSEFDGTGNDFDKDANLPEFNYASTLEELTSALENGEDVTLLNDITLTDTLTMNGGTLDGNGFTLSMNAGTGKVAINPTGGTIKNLNFANTYTSWIGQSYAIGSIQFASTTLTEDLYIENVNLAGYDTSIDVDANENSVFVKDCEIVNLVQIANAEVAEFTNCHFYADDTSKTSTSAKQSIIFLMGDMTFTNCHFEEDVNFYLDSTKFSGDVHFNNSTYGNNGVEDRPIDSFGFIQYWFPAFGVYGYAGTFGDTKPAQTHFNWYINGELVWDATAI